MNRFASVIVAVVGISLAPACAADDPGSAPVIGNLTATPNTVAVGATATLSLTFDLQDVDADADSWTASIESMGTVVATTAPSAIAGAQGQEQARVSGQLIVLAPVPGTYTLRIHVSDANGNESNALEAEITAE